VSATTGRTPGDLAPTPGQTIGPFFGYALPYDGGADLVPTSHPGAIRFHGRVLDGAGDPVPDALVEIWQADGAGRVPREPGSLRRDGFTFTGWGRAAVDNTGHYAFTTVAPGPVAAGGAAYVAVTVFARGLLNRLFTRAYLPGPATDADPFLATVPAERRGTLVAREDERGFVFDIRLQGEGETVFLTHPRH
jgi:protocatechuate 3,4-dioxygenase alpha subunit